MKTHTLMACFGVVVLSSSLIGCVTLSGSASLSADGSTAVLAGGAPLEIRAKQPELPPPPPPKKAKIVEERIEISEKVQFAYNDSTILPASDDLLNDVATVMKQHPEVKKIRIEGHASSEGNDKYNKDLSDRRAKSVMDFLIKAGVDPERMEAIGYGEERPIADNDTEEGREKNRRVEFNIIARLSKDELEKAKAAAASAADEAGEEAETSEDDSAEENADDSAEAAEE
jgi:outer membrane protein OmpA-like peptidoglycan-associated protein